MNIYDTLRSEHQHIMGTLNTLLDCSQQDHAKRVELFQQLSTELIKHSEREAHTVYSELGELDQFRNIVNRLSQEHATVANLVEKISTLNDRDASWSPNLMQLREALRKHMLVEETSLFPDAERLFNRNV